jgi:hypothetical protein
VISPASLTLPVCRTKSSWWLMQKRCGGTCSGVHTNKSFVLNLLSHPDFVTGTVDTGFIARNPELLQPLQSSNRQVINFYFFHQKDPNKIPKNPVAPSVLQQASPHKPHVSSLTPFGLLISITEVYLVLPLMKDSFDCSSPFSPPTGKRPYHSLHGDIFSFFLTASAPSVLQQASPAGLKP